MEPFLKIELAGPPQGKGRARSFLRELSDGRRFIGHYTPEKTRAYEERLKVEATVAMLQTRRRLLEGVPVKCEILSIFEVPESWTKAEYAAAIAGEIRPICKPDWDNIAKVTDALNKVVWKDDAQIVDGRVQKFYGERSFLHIEVYV